MSQSRTREQQRSMILRIVTVQQKGEMKLKHGAQNKFMVR